MTGPYASESTRHCIDALHERDKAITPVACAAGALLGAWFGWLPVAVAGGVFATRRYVRAYRAERRSEKALAAERKLREDQP